MLAALCPDSFQKLQRPIASNGRHSRLRRSLSSSRSPFISFKVTAIEADTVPDDLDAAPMMDLAGDNPFADLMSKAVKLKGAQQAQLRTVFDAWPQYFQHSLFMQDSVLSARELPFPERLRAAQDMKASGNAKFAADELEEAVAEYEKALAVFKFVVNTDPGWKKKGIEDVDLRVFDYSCSDCGEEHEDRDGDQRELDALKLSCYLNIAGT